MKKSAHADSHLNADTSDSAAVEIRSVSKSLGATSVLQDLSLTIKMGELFFLLGPSGCGKTTLLRLISGFIEPDQGSIFLNGRDLLSVPPYQRGISIVFQNYALWPHMTVAENVAFGLKMRRRSTNEIRDRVQVALDLTAIGELSTRFPNELSGGQQQRVALARALVVEPDLILLDEPLSNLDSQLRLELRRELRSLHARIGKTMLYVTHDQSEALALASRVAIMNAGQILQVGTPAEMLEQPSSPFVRDFFGGSSTLSGTVETDANKKQVKISSGFLPYPDDFEPLENGAAVKVAIRNESVSIVHSKPNA